MSDAPGFIWADPPEIFDGEDIWRSGAGGNGIPYVRRDYRDAGQPYIDACMMLAMLIATVAVAWAV